MITNALSRKGIKITPIFTFTFSINCNLEWALCTNCIGFTGFARGFTFFKNIKIQITLTNFINVRIVAFQTRAFISFIINGHRVG
jgi:hypothetical protein